MPESNAVCWEEDDRPRARSLRRTNVWKHGRSTAQSFKTEPKGQPRETDRQRKQSPWSTNGGGEMKAKSERNGLAKTLTVPTKPMDFGLKGARTLHGRGVRRFHRCFAPRIPSSPLGDRCMILAQSANRLTFTKGESGPLTSRRARVRDSTSARQGSGMSSKPGSNADSHQPRSSFKRG